MIVVLQFQQTWQTASVWANQTSMQYVLAMATYQQGPGAEVEQRGTHRDGEVADAVHLKVLCYFQILHLCLIPEDKRVGLETNKESLAKAYASHRKCISASAFKLTRSSNVL